MAWRSAAFSLLFVFGSVEASAADRSKIAVLDIQTTGVDPELAPTLTEILSVEVEALGRFEVIAGRDIETMLGFEEQRDAVGCDDVACLAEIGGALGVERIIASHVGKVGTTYVVNIKLINIQEVRTERRVYETVAGKVDLLITTIRKSVDKLLGGRSTAPSSAAAAPSSADAQNNRPSASPAQTQTPADYDSLGHASSPYYSEGSGIGFWPWALWAGGAVGVGVGIFFDLKAKGFNDDVDPENPNLRGNDLAEAVLDGQSAAETASVAYGLGIISAAAGVLVWYFSDDEPGQVAIAPQLGLDRTGMAMAVEW